MSIPKIIHYCWFGGNPLPEDARRCMASWKKYCPDYEIRRWDESNYDYTRLDYTREAYEAKKWAFVTDVARLEIVYNHGGIYLDTDVELVKPLDPFLEDDAFMGFEGNFRVATGLGFGAVKGHPVIGGNLHMYDTLHFLQEDGTMNLEACPVITTRYLNSLGLRQEDTVQKVEGLTVYPREYFCPVEFETGILKKTRKTVSIHWFSGSWQIAQDLAQLELERQQRRAERKSSRRVAIGTRLLGKRGYETLKSLLRK